MNGRIFRPWRAAAGIWGAAAARRANRPAGPRPRRLRQRRRSSRRGRGHPHQLPSPPGHRHHRRGRGGSPAPDCRDVPQWPAATGRCTAMTARGPTITPPKPPSSPANAGQLAPRWQVDIGSSGRPPSGAPSVADGRVYVGSSAPSGPELLRLRRGTGIAIWSADLGHGSGLLQRGHRRHRRPFRAPSWWPAAATRPTTG